MSAFKLNGPSSQEKGLKISFRRKGNCYNVYTSVRIPGQQHPKQLYIASISVFDSLTEKYKHKINDKLFDVWAKHFPYKSLPLIDWENAAEKIAASKEKSTYEQAFSQLPIEKIIIRIDSLNIQDKISFLKKLPVEIQVNCLTGIMPQSALDILSSMAVYHQRKLLSSTSKSDREYLFSSDKAAFIEGHLLFGISRLSSSDRDDIFSRLTPQQIFDAFKMIDRKNYVSVLVSMPSSIASFILLHLDDNSLNWIISDMPVVNRVDVLSYMDDGFCASCLLAMAPRDVSSTLLAFGYDDRVRVLSALSNDDRLAIFLSMMPSDRIKVMRVMDPGSRVNQLSAMKPSDLVDTLLAMDLNERIYVLKLMAFSHQVSVFLSMPATDRVQTLMGMVSQDQVKIIIHMAVDKRIETLMAMPPSERVQALLVMKIKQQLEVFINMSLDNRSETLLAMPPDEQVKILLVMDTDKQVATLKSMPLQSRNSVLSAMIPEIRSNVIKSMNDDEGQVEIL